MALIWLRPDWVPAEQAVAQIADGLRQAAKESAGVLLDTAGVDEDHIKIVLIEAAWTVSEDGVDIEGIACHGADCQTGLLGVLLEQNQACLQLIKQDTNLQRVPEPLATQLVNCLQQFPQQWFPSARSLAIIVPTYNCASKIERTLQSIEDSINFFQGNLPFASLYESEVVIIDDASTDNTAAVIQRYIDGKSGFRFGCHPVNRGAGIARNTGVNFSRGEILFFCDGDDLFLERHLLLGVLALEISLDQPQILDRLLEYADISLDQEITSYIHNINGHPPYGFVNLGVRIDEDILPEWYQRITDSLPINLVVRRSIFQFIGGFSEEPVYQRLRCGEDVALRDCLYRLFNGVNVDVETTHYIRYPGNNLDRQLKKFQCPFSESSNFETLDVEDLNLEKSLREEKIYFLCRKLAVAESSVRPFIAYRISQPKFVSEPPKEGEDNLRRLLLNSKESLNRIIALDWQISAYSGWGVFGTNLVIQLLRQKEWTPVYLQNPYLRPHDIYPLVNSDIFNIPILKVDQRNNDLLHLENLVIIKPLLFQAMMNDFQSKEYEFPFEQRIGLIFMEDTHVSLAGEERANRLPIIISGSQWCNDLVSEYYRGNAYAIPQGVDPNLFQPSQATGYFGDRFVIFSGGKLEYRKGQDIVIAAFKCFYEQHPDALLLCNWSTALPQYMNGLQHTGYVQGLPDTEGDLRSNISQWLVKNGLPESSFYCVGFTPNIQMPYVLREAHAAIFPNRAEGGTNLVAMEAIACGIPTLLSQNTGHLDLINMFGIDALKTQKLVTPYQPYVGTESWGQSDPDEVVEWLEQVYQNNQAQKAQALSQSAAIRQTMSWEIQIQKMTEAITRHVTV
ncbi:glycosyltransferase [Synechococcus elongatus]|uniref:glycosyltransferase n=1 Tax=Synechococcus elongatus TaxID=32046 RepID=UPI000F7E484E|nr:glycosyltransferase [Synechococcus elongatus]